MRILTKRRCVLSLEVLKLSGNYTRQTVNTNWITQEEIELRAHYHKQGGFIYITG